MKKDKKRSVKKLGIMVRVIVISAMVLGIVSGAAYINRNSVKRVVSTQGGGGTAFSSNYLVLVAKDTTAYSIKNINFPQNGTSVSFEIDVCNYVQNDPSKVNEKDIDYTLTMTLLNSDGTPNTGTFDGLSVDKEGAGFVNGVCIIDGGTLTGKIKSVDKYIVTVPQRFVADNIMIQAVAEPSDSSLGAVNSSKLGRIFAFSYGSDSAVSWTGSFLETTVNGYDAFNYVIKGQGKGTVTLTWAPDKIEINKVFLDKNNYIPQDTDGKKSLEIEVDSDIINRYDIQFYKVAGADYSTIEAVNGYVDVTFTPSTPTENT